jgi:hypothetical protein
MDRPVVWDSFANRFRVCSLTLIVVLMRVLHMGVRFVGASRVLEDEDYGRFLLGCVAKPSAELDKPYIELNCD